MLIDINYKGKTTVIHVGLLLLQRSRYSPIIVDFNDKTGRRLRALYQDYINTIFAEIYVMYEGVTFYAWLPVTNTSESIHISDEDVLNVRNLDPTIETV